MDIAKQWRGRGPRYRLEGQRNTQTGEVRFPPRPVALDENAAEWETVALSGKGEIYSYTTLHQAPSGFDGLTPYPVALVRLAEGPLVTAQLTDCDENDVQIGTAVEMVTRHLKDTGEDGVLIYGYKFRPAVQ
ncbi:MAG: Zn-ribbon domain-containing OB-fold protein [Chloroflexaceae bacterium]|nr:Zn-ribbon domain-containing OB-fold protein [Chloroflexaceae bacterium]